MMTRVFHPIGQGALYTERFSHFTVIYDCGSETDESLVEACVSETLTHREALDAVFISHLHNDHVNGLESLLGSWHVKKVFLPLIAPDESVLLCLHNAVNHKRDQFIEQLIWLSSSVDSTMRGNDSPFVLVKPFEGHPPDPESGPSYTVDACRGSIESGALLRRNRADRWIFVPFNFQRPTRARRLRVALDKLGIRIQDGKDFSRIWNNTRSRAELVNAYADLPGNPNANSMTLYSGPESALGDDSFFFHPIYFALSLGEGDIASSKAGCLYMGDYEARGARKYQDLSLCYGRYWPLIGTLQVPHHGAYLNFNPALNRNGPAYNIISAGVSNPYRHPHPLTLRQIVASNCTPIVVNENPGTQAVFHIHGP